MSGQAFWVGGLAFWVSWLCDIKQTVFKGLDLHTVTTQPWNRRKSRSSAQAKSSKSTSFLTCWTLGSRRWFKVNHTAFYEICLVKSEQKVLQRPQRDRQLLPPAKNLFKQIGSRSEPKFNLIESESVPERISWKKKLADNNKSMKSYPACKELKKLTKSKVIAPGSNEVLRTNGLNLL